MIHTFFEEIFTTEYGQDTWDDIVARAAVEMSGIIGMQQYPDEVTFGIVSAAADVTGREAEDLLRFLGARWIAYTAKGTYAHYYESAESTRDFLSELNNMHTDLGLVMPGLQPPSFSVTGDPDGPVTVRYFSDRAGLTPFVEGLLIGLGDFYGEPCSVKMTGVKNESRDYDEFELTFEGQ